MNFSGNGSPKDAAESSELFVDTKVNYVFQMSRVPDKCLILIQIKGIVLVV